MDCPFCSFPRCYDSGFSLECANPECRHFTLKQCMTFVQEHFREQILKLLQHPELKAEALPPIFVITHIHPPTALKISWPQPNVPEPDRLSLTVDLGP